MTGLSPLLRELRIRYYQWALKELHPLHPDVPAIVHRLHQLQAQRPRVEVRAKSQCAQMPGMCAHDPACEDRRCPGLYQQDGGHTFNRGVAFSIEQRKRA